MTYSINGKQIPPVAIGTWAWGGGTNGSNMIFGEKSDEVVLREAFNAAYDSGFNLIDTAAVYGMGSSEQLIGSFVKDKSIILSDKFTPASKFNAAKIDSVLSGSKSRLNGLIPDIYWLHTPNDYQKNIGYMCKLLKQGEIGSIGASNFNLAQLKEAEEILSEQGFHLAGVQNHYSLIYRSSEKAGLLDWCRAKNIPFFSYMVLEQGALTGRYNGSNGFPSLSRRRLAFSKGKLKKLEPLHDALKKTGEKYGLSISDTAVLWAISKGTVPIVGVTKKYQAEALKLLIGKQLTSEEIKLLETEADKTGIEISGSWEHKA